MFFGPIVWREFVVQARLRRTYFDRASAPLIFLIVLIATLLVWYFKGWEYHSIREMARFTLFAFGFIFMIQMMSGIGMVANFVGPKIAGERDRKSLDAPLATRLTSAEIVLGMMAAGLIKHGSGILAMFPLVLLMIPLGGIDQNLLLLAYACLGSTTLGCALAIASSVKERTGPLAVKEAASWAGFWLVAPFFTVMVMPRVWPWGYSWIAPFATTLLQASPLALVLNLAGVIRRGSFVEAAWTMIGLQLAGTAVLIVWSIARLRAVSRAIYDGEGRLLFVLQNRLPSRKRWPACGDDPVFWRERYGARRIARPWERVANRIVNVALLGGLVFVTAWFAQPAFVELFAEGYGVHSSTYPVLDVTPFAMALVRGRSGGPPVGLARPEFNSVLRVFTATLEAIMLLTASGMAAECLAWERQRDTWLGLITTPLSGWEIMRGKILGIVYKLQTVLLPLIAVWLVALVTGALHPLGLIASFVVLFVGLWFHIAMGTYYSLASNTINVATSRTLTPALILPMSIFLPILLPTSFASVLMGMGSIAMQSWVALFSYDDVYAMIHSGSFPQLKALLINTNEGAGRVLLSLGLGVWLQALGGCYFTFKAIRQFDAFVGRPIRPRVEVLEIEQSLILKPELGQT